MTWHPPRVHVCFVDNAAPGFSGQVELGGVGVGMERSSCKIPCSNARLDSVKWTLTNGLCTLCI